MKHRILQVQHSRQPFSIVVYWLLLPLLTIIPVSCSAQETLVNKNNSLKNISTAVRSDGKGYVIRLHLAHNLTSFDFTQPAPFLVQIELHESHLDTTNIQLYDSHNIINGINYTALKNGIGLSLHLTENEYFLAAAYPDGASKDLLVGLTKTTRRKLALNIKTKKPFSWADSPTQKTAIQTKNLARPVDSTYLKIWHKMEFDTVVLDAGHGGFDTGAIGWHHTLEKNVALAITKKVGHYINKYLPDVNVVYTRDSDKFVGLKERGRIANKARGDLFVCIHANAARSPLAHGTETYFLGLEGNEAALRVMERENKIVTASGSHPGHISKQQLMIYELANSGNIKNSQILAGMIQHQFKNYANRVSRGVKQARFVVLYHASMPAVLVETGFITNPKECKFLTSKHGQRTIAMAIFRAIRNYKQMIDQSLNYNTDN